MGAIIFLILFIVAVLIGIPLYAAIDWHYSYRDKGETFKEYWRKF